MHLMEESRLTSCVHLEALGICNELATPKSERVQ